MKILVITSLFLFATNIAAIEFYKCTDEKGQVHFSNLSADTLDSNCNPEDDRYALMLQEDYSNLEIEFNKYNSDLTKIENDDESLLQIDSLIHTTKNLMDSDKALDELLENSTNQ